MHYSTRDKARAQARLEADLRADDISIEGYSRECARIEAGTSKYFDLTRDRGLIERATSGDRHAQIKLGVRAMIAATIVVILLAIISAGAALLSPDSNPSVAPSAPQQVVPMDDDDFEDDDD